MLPWGRGACGVLGELGWGPLGGYLEVQQPREQGLPGMGGVFQQVLPLDDIDDLGQQQVLARVPQPGVKDPVRLERGRVLERFTHGHSLRAHFPRTPCPHVRREKLSQRAPAKGRGG